jgi:queuine tRNA-ribosyltransferase
LFRTSEILGLRLMTWHNLHLYLGTLRRAREAIAAGVFEEFRREFTAAYTEGIEVDEIV